MYTDKYAGIDPEHPYEDAKPKYERDYKLGKYVIVNNYKNAQTASNRAQMGFLPRMWSAQHAANYMKLTGNPPFKITEEAYADPQAYQLLQSIQQQMAVRANAPLNATTSS